MSQGQKDSKKNFMMIVGIIAAVGLALFAYLMFYVSPEETVERVKVIAVTPEGCIAETMDGFSAIFCSWEMGEPVIESLKALQIDWQSNLRAYVSAHPYSNESHNFRSEPCI